MTTAKLFFISALFLIGCAGPGKISSPGRPVVKEPVLLSKTSGEFVFLGGFNGELTYKEIRVALNPNQEPGSPTDYVLFTGASVSNFSLRKNQKIIATPNAASQLNKQGYTSVKGLHPGPMMQLTKNGSFLFMRAVEGKSSRGESVNGYFLEFDNGRNIFFGGENTDVDLDRQFLYALRDEGKEIHMAFLSKSLDESKLAEIISLLQPQVAVLLVMQQWTKLKLKICSRNLKIKCLKDLFLPQNPPIDILSSRID